VIVKASLTKSGSSVGVRAQDAKGRRMSRTAIPVGRSEAARASFVPASGRSESAEFNFGLIGALAACVAFWISVVLTAFWLI